VAKSPPGFGGGFLINGDHPLLRLRADHNLDDGRDRFDSEYTCRRDGNDRFDAENHCLRDLYDYSNYDNHCQRDLDNHFDDEAYCFRHG
jgi:hypothetical protein